MRICVCIKQVPDTAEVRLDPVTNNLIRDGVPSIINHDDKAGLEAALRLKEQYGATVVAVCMGPPQADVALREALAMGADEAVLLSGREFGGSDTYATAHIIAAGLKEIGYDFIITGRQAIDGDTAQVGPQIAEQLHVPQVSYVEDIKVEDGGKSLVVKRQYEDEAHVIRVKTPCLLTAIAELAEPRYMNAGLIVDAYNTEIKVLGFKDVEHNLHPDYIGAARPDGTGSPTQVVQSFNKQAKQAGEVKSGLSVDEAVEAIMDKMKEKHII